MLTQNTYIDKRTIEGLTVGTYIISCFASKDNKSVLNSLKFSLFFICPALPSMSKRQIAYEKNAATPIQIHSSFGPFGANVS